jgi:hypothetical protein
VQLYDVYSSANIIRVIESRTVRWAGHVTWTGETHTGFWWGDLMKRDHFEGLDVNWRMILKRICKKWDGEA